jgi:hypothetical protein
MLFPLLSWTFSFTFMFRTFFGILSSFILKTCPYHLILLFVSLPSKVLTLDSLCFSFRFLFYLFWFSHVSFLKIVNPVAARSEARALIARTLDRGFESRLKYGCLSSSFCVLLSCVGRDLATGWSLAQGVLPSVEID